MDRVRPGYSAAVYAVRANLKPLLITGNDQGGQLMTTTDVENWPGDPVGIQGPDLMQRLLQHAERLNTELVFDHIHTAKLDEKPMRLVGDAGECTCDSLIIATGVSAQYLGLPSEEAFRGQGKVEIKWSGTLHEVTWDDSGVLGIKVNSTVDGSITEVPVKGVFIAVGHKPNTGIFEGQLEMKGGYIITRMGVQGMATATSAGTGCMAALDAQRDLETLDA